MPVISDVYAKIYLQLSRYKHPTLIIRQFVLIDCVNYGSVFSISRSPIDRPLLSLSLLFAFSMKANLGVRETMLWNRSSFVNAV